MNNIVRFAHLAALAFGLSACGGGGGGDSPVVPSVNSTAISYACDKSTSAAAALHTPAYVNVYEPVVYGANALTFDRLTVQIDGQPYDLNIAVSTPSAPTAVIGIVVKVHGFSATQASLPPAAMVDPYWDAQMNARGYLAISVALRGNFGSTGDRLIDLAATGLLAAYQTKQIPYADLQLAATKYQSSSVVAILQKLALDPAYQPYMSTIMLVGASGGADTVLQTSADSAVFKAATKKAVVRLTGLDSVFDTNPEAAPGVSEYSARIAKDTVGSLWIGGEIDPITSIGQLACQFKFYDQAAGFPNFFYVVPGLGHGGQSDLFSSSISPIFKQYMQLRGFGGF